MMDKKTEELAQKIKKIEGIQSVCIANKEEGLVVFKSQNATDILTNEIAFMVPTDSMLSSRCDACSRSTILPCRWHILPVDEQIKWEQ